MMLKPHSSFIFVDADFAGNFWTISMCQMILILLNHTMATTAAWSSGNCSCKQRLHLVLQKVSILAVMHFRNNTSNSGPPSMMDKCGPPRSRPIEVLIAHKLIL